MIVFLYVYVLYLFQVILFSKFFLLKVVEFLSIYFLFSVFLFLKKMLWLGNYTSNVNRFWKQSFYLFWVLEFMLFCVYLYLFFNTTSELWWMDWSLVNTFNSLNIQNLCVVFITWALIFTFLFILTTSLMYSLFSHLVWVIVLITLFILFYGELNVLFYLNSYFSSYIYIYDFSENVWNLDLDILIIRPIFFYLYTFTLLKLIHIMFIIVFLCKFAGFQNTGATDLSCNTSFLSVYFLKQNLVFLFFFYILTLLIALKPYLYFFITFVYGEMFVHDHNYFIILVNKVFCINYYL